MGGLHSKATWPYNGCANIIAWTNSSQMTRTKQRATNTRRVSLNKRVCLWEGGSCPYSCCYTDYLVFNIITAYQYIIGLTVPHLNVIYQQQQHRIVARHNADARGEDQKETFLFLFFFSQYASSCICSTEL